MFIMHVANSLESENELQDRLLRIVEVKETDQKVIASASDFADNLQS